MKKILSFLLAAVIVLSSFTIVFAKTDTLDAKVKTNIPYMNGVGNNIFAPNRNVTRQEAATMISRAIKSDGIQERIPNFKDADSIDDWAKGSVGKLQRLGVIEGDANGNFNPKENIDRASLAAMLVRTYEKFNEEIKIENISFKDVSEDAWYSEVVKKATTLRIVKGKGHGKFNPKDKATRAETVAMVNRMLGLNNIEGINKLKTEFRDVAKWPSWAKEDILIATTQFDYTLEDGRAVVLVKDKIDNREDGIRQGDVSDANSWQDANLLFKDETVSGNIGTSDNRVDWYKIKIDEFGRLSLKLKHLEDGCVDLSIYGCNGDNDSSIASDTYGNKSVRRITQGLAPGTYYIKIYSSNEGRYTLENNFHPDRVEGDSAGGSYLDAQEIDKNSNIHGHIGYYDDSSNKYITKWFRIDVDEIGELSLETKHNFDKNIELYLYGVDGDNDSSIMSDTYGNKSVRRFNVGLKPGTYYIKIYSDCYGDFELNLNFKEETFGENDAGYSYLNAEDIQEDSMITGNIGHYYETGSKNTRDWFRIVLDEPGTLNIDLTHNRDKCIELILYGQDGDNGSSINSDTYGNGSVRNINQTLEPGTYFICVYSDNYGGYILRTSFE